jgi:hypothetical protein
MGRERGDRGGVPQARVNQAACVSGGFFAVAM